MTQLVPMTSYQKSEFLKFDLKNFFKLGNKFNFKEFNIGEIISA